MKKNKLRVIIRIPESLYIGILRDLRRKHPFAYERVGFVFGTSKLLSKDVLLICLNEYQIIADKEYVPDRSVGARINTSAIRLAMQKVLSSGKSGFHIHLHDLEGQPTFSFTDLAELPAIAESFQNYNENESHGMLVLSSNHANGFVWQPNVKDAIVTTQISIVGHPSRFFFDKNSKIQEVLVNRYKRQSFLGEYSQSLFSRLKIGIVGAGGGGSHITQQLAHLGVMNPIVFDEDIIEETNLNRCVGARSSDVLRKKSKSKIARRIFKSVLPNSKVTIVGRWQDNTDILHQCDFIFGSIDTFLGRRDLEAECRRYLIPYVDIGMDVFDRIDDEPFIMSGQVFLSMPGKPCMYCMKILTEKTLSEEARKYGAAGGGPQVVWANGVLASTAVGIFVDVITGWSGQNEPLYYLSYEGNKGTVIPHPYLEYLGNISCSHYPLIECGRPLFKKL